MTDVFGTALLDQFNNNAAEVLLLHNTYGEPEEMPVDVFFRDETEMPDLELLALNMCKGEILDIGAGVGSHALLLQAAGLEVTALEISNIACAIMQKRGVKNIINSPFLSYQDKKYDTLLMLMNGIGFTGTLNKLPEILNHCRKLLKPGGQIIFDSSDISYLYHDIPFPQNKYFGEISYQYEYGSEKGPWFDWLYVDQRMLFTLSTQHNFNFELLFEDEEDQYLACLKP